jgi:hypothetical protein
VRVGTFELGLCSYDLDIHGDCLIAGITGIAIEHFPKEYPCQEVRDALYMLY